MVRGVFALRGRGMLGIVEIVESVARGLSGHSGRIRADAGFLCALEFLNGYLVLIALGHSGHIIYITFVLRI
jgi:hypothetical protein